MCKPFFNKKKIEIILDQFFFFKILPSAKNIITNLLHKHQKKMRQILKIKRKYN